MQNIHPHVEVSPLDRERVNARERQPDSQIEKERGRQTETERQTDRDRQTDRETETEREISVQISKILYSSISCSCDFLCCLHFFFSPLLSFLLVGWVGGGGGRVFINIWLGGGYGVYQLLVGEGVFINFWLGGGRVFINFWLGGVFINFWLGGGMVFLIFCWCWE